MKLFSHSSIILPVKDLEQSVNYYKDVLGFSISFLWQDPPTYAVINRDDSVGIHLTESENFETAEEHHPRLYVFVHDPDKLFEEYTQAGADIIESINDTDYQMREFLVRDINGYKLVFGKALSN